MLPDIIDTSGNCPNGRFTGTGLVHDHLYDLNANVFQDSGRKAGIQEKLEHC